jgi:hypothetical protein
MGRKPEPVHASNERRAMAEGVGTFLLVLVATGSGLTASRLLFDNAALSLLASAVTTAGALVGLILAFGALSGGHFNPLITGLQLLAGERKLDCAIAYIAAQFLGGIAGALLAGLVFGAGAHCRSTDGGLENDCQRSRGQRGSHGDRLRLRDYRDTVRLLRQSRHRGCGVLRNGADCLVANDGAVLRGRNHAPRHRRSLERSRRLNPARPSMGGNERQKRAGVGCLGQSLLPAAINDQ